MILHDTCRKNDVSVVDISLAKTFLEIATTGSFVAAAGRLNITQTAVSARIRTLEEQLGRRLFVRNKSGARLTAAGERFVRHATTLVQVWDHARQQVGLPPGRTDVASVGAEISLWNPIVVDWLVWMKQEAPEIALRADVDVPHKLIERVGDGSLDLAVVYAPPLAAGEMAVELLLEEKLVMVTTRDDATPGPQDDYVRVDWGPAFLSSQHIAFPDIASPGVSVSHGPLALNYLIRVGGTGYFRQSVVEPYLASGRLMRVIDAPEFSHSMHMVYSTRAEPALLETMRSGFFASAKRTVPKSGG